MVEVNRHRPPISDGVGVDVRSFPGGAESGCSIRPSDSCGAGSARALGFLLRLRRAGTLDIRLATVVRPFASTSCTTRPFTIGESSLPAITSTWMSLRKAFFHELTQSATQRCPSLKVSMIEETPDTVIFEWENDGCDGHPPQRQVRRISRGNPGVLSLAFAEKRPYSDEPILGCRF